MITLKKIVGDIPSDFREKLLTFSIMNLHEKSVFYVSLIFFSSEKLLCVNKISWIFSLSSISIVLLISVWFTELVIGLLNTCFLLNRTLQFFQKSNNSAFLSCMILFQFRSHISVSVQAQKSSVQKKIRIKRIQKQYK